MLRYLWVSLTVIILDQLTKYLVYSQMPLRERINVLPVFDITYNHNPGVAFSFLADAGVWKTYFLISLTLLLSVILFIWIARMKPWEKLQAIGMSMILGGAIGNLTDRFLHTDTANHKEGVVDFILVYWNDHLFPAFNIADSAITIGVIVILWFMIFVVDPAEQDGQERVNEQSNPNTSIDIQSTDKTRESK